MQKKTRYEKFWDLKPQTFISFCTKCGRQTPQRIYQEVSKVKYTLRCNLCGKIKQTIFTAERLYEILEKEKEAELK